MIYKDIIGKKVINNEKKIFIINLKNLALNWRLTRIPYLISLILVYFTYIFMPLMILSCFPSFISTITFGLGWANLCICIGCFLVLMIRRIMDIGKIWLLCLCPIIGLYFFYTNIFDFSSSILIVEQSEFDISTDILINIDMILFGLLSLSLLPGKSKINRYGLPSGIDKCGNCYIKYKFGSINNFIDKFSLSFILSIINSSLTIELFNTNKRICNGELVYYYFSYQVIAILFSLLLYILGSILPEIYFVDLILEMFTYLFYCWIFIYAISAIIRRLHDSYSSGFWVLGLIIPYLNVYVLYLILFKGSWHYIDQNTISDNISH